MLIYHPAFDAYHCVFRMLILAEHLGQLEVDKGRILDFYLAFPSALTGVRWPNNVRSARRAAASFQNPYRMPVSARATLREMHDMQDAALRCLAAAELIEVDALQAGEIRRTEHEIPAALSAGINDYLQEGAEATDLILVKLASIPLLGADGLKDRTSLMDFRYDVA